MIDLKDYRANPSKYHQGAIHKGHMIDWAQFDQLDEQLRTLKQQAEELKAQRNALTDQVDELRKAGQPFDHLIEQVKGFKEQIQSLDSQLEQTQQAFDAMLLTIPVPAADDVPVGKSDAENVVAEQCGVLPTFDFTPRPHWEILETKGYLDQERAVKLSGSRFQIVRGEFALLEFALIQWVVQKLMKKGFEFTMVPQLVREDAMMITGFLPNDAMNLYRVNPKTSVEQTDWEEDDLWLIGTAEVALVSQHQGDTFAAADLPRRYVGFSSCFRREAGTYGKDAKGLIRLHQFEKVEMVSFVMPGDALKEHEFLREIEEEIFTELGLPYQRILICTGDLGAPAAKKYDLEAWFPGIGEYKEVTSTSNTVDFQTRRGQITYKDGNEKGYVYSLNGTAVALGRALACIVENYQTAEGDIRIPTVLQPWMGKEKI